MVYPNFKEFRSLSTNHLETGSHVKRTPRAIYDKKRALLTLPLMPLPNANLTTAPSMDLTTEDGLETLQELEDVWRMIEPLQTGLLDLPEGRLPSWSEMPVLDLHGEFTSEGEIKDRGQARRAELLGCSTPSSDLGHGPTHDAKALLCMAP